MNLFGRMLQKMAGVTTGQTYSLTDATLGRFFGGSSNAGKPVTEDGMMAVSAAWSCIRILSETIGALPWHVYEDDGAGNVTVVKDHPVAEVLTISPNALMTPVELKEAKVLNLCQHGNTYSYREFRPNGDLLSVTPLLSTNVEPKQRKDGTIYYRVLEDGQWVDVPQEKIWHVKGFGRNGLMGLSPIGAAREALGTAMAMEEFGAKFFSQGGMPSGTVTVEKFLNADQRTIARENLNQMLGGLGNAHRFALFEGGMKPEPWGAMPLEDMQFILSRKFSIQEICRFYRIPPHMVADLDKATFSNIEQQSQEFVMFTLLPYLTRFEASASKWLFKPGDRRKYYLRFNYEGLLRADSAARAGFYNLMLQNGVMTRNEVRRKENLTRSDEENMDSFTVQLNMTPIDKLGETPEKEPTAPPVVAPPVAAAETDKQLSEQNFNIVIPDSIKQHLTQRVVVPGIKELASAMEDAAARQSLTGAATIAHIMSLTEQMANSVEEMKVQRNMDRIAILDDDGEPIGVRMVPRAD